MPPCDSTKLTKTKATDATICISHKEDVDGIASAMLIKRLFEPKSVVLVDYGTMIKALEKIADTLASEKKKPREIFICDLALSKKNEQEFVEIMRKLVSDGIKVTYVDHHDLGEDTESELKGMKVQLVHNIDECTSVQIYELYKKQLADDDHAAFFAAAAALTDYMDNKPVASKLVRRFDRQFLMLQSTALQYIISANQNDDPLLESVVATLSERKYTHDIKEGFSTARKYAQMVGDAAKEIETSMKKLKNLAYASSTSSLSTSMVVNFVLGTSGKPVAVIYKPRDDMPGSCQISVRGSDECKVHLGRTVSGIAAELGGNGGGHEKACGAIISEDKITKFLKTLNEAVS